MSHVCCGLCRIPAAYVLKRVARLSLVAKVDIMDRTPTRTLSAREAKNRFGYLIDMARQEPISIEKHGRPVVVVISIEDYERMVAVCRNKKEQNERE